MLSRSNSFLKLLSLAICGAISLISLFAITVKLKPAHLSFLRLRLVQTALSFPTGLRSSSSAERNISNQASLIPIIEQIDSAAWAPYILSDCAANLPPHFAPCQFAGLRGILKADELVYPDFAIKFPILWRQEDKIRWQTVKESIGGRASTSDGWLVYQGQTGQDIVFGNATVRARFDQWSEDSCMSGQTSDRFVKWEQSESEELYDSEYIDNVILINGPDSWSFQHFLDRSTHVVLQSLHSSPLQRNTVVATGRAPQPVVTEMWNSLSITTDRLLHSPALFKAKHLVYSCRAPLIHPYFSLRLAELFKLDRRARLDERKVVLYFSRSQGNTLNGGRQILNEDVLLQSLQDKLEDRAFGEELVVYDPASFPVEEEFRHWVSTNVRAMIGPHGGAFQALRWAAPDTLILEFMPLNWICLEYYEEASMLSLQYALTLMDTIGTTDMEIPLTSTLALIDSYLGKPLTRSVLKRHYDWTAEELHIQ